MDLLRRTSPTPDLRVDSSASSYPAQLRRTVTPDAGTVKGAEIDLLGADRGDARAAARRMIAVKVAWMAQCTGWRD